MVYNYNMSKSSSASSVEELVNKMAQDAVKRAGSEKEEAPLEMAGRGAIDSEDAVADAFSRIDENAGFYATIYKRHPIPKEYNGRPVVIYTVQQPDLVKDWESELLKLGRDNSWENGLYEVRLFQTGQPGVQACRQIPLHIPTFMPSLSPSSSVDPMAQITNTAKVIREIGSMGANPNGDALAKSMIEMYKAGAEATKAGLTKEPTTAEIMKLAKELAPQQEPTSGLSEILLMLREAGVFARPTTDDFLTKLVQAKQAGLIPETPSGGVNQSLELINTLMPIIERLSGKNDGGPTSIGVELVRALGPQLGELIKDITGTINNLVALKAGQKQSKIGPLSLPTTPPPSGVEVKEPEPIKHPLMLELRDAIEAKNRNYFPRLMHGIGYWFENGGQYLQAFASETLSHDQAMAFLVENGGAYFSQGKASEYIKAFIIWYKKVLGITKDEEKKEIIGICQECSASFKFETLEDWEQDAKVCGTKLETGEVCNGKLILEEEK